MKDQIEVVSEQSPEQTTYIPNDKEIEVVSDIFRKFTNSSSSRNQNFQYFDNDNLITYIEDSVRRFITNIDERDGLEDWQARVNTQTTRNKVLAVLGKVVSVLPIAQFNGRGDEDLRKGIILTNLYEYSEDVDDYETFMIGILLEAIVKGTAIGYEGVEKVERKIRDIKGIGDDITITENTEKKTNLCASIVPLEEFYPSSVGISCIKKMPYCFWRKVVSYSQFQNEWDTYERYKLVQPKRTFTDEEAKPFYLDYISSDVQEGEVEIVRYYDRYSDQYVIIANGIWLNPISNKSNRFLISPLPFNHKELPFWDIKFDYFGADFFYGKSLPDRLKSIQDVLNVLTNMLLDQSFLTIFPPILVAGFDDIEDDYMRPGRRIPVDTQGLPLNQAYFKLDPGTPGGWHQFILNYTSQLMEQASVDQVSQGIAGGGDRTTAEEIRTAAAGVSAVLGLFARLVNYGVKRKALLRGANIIQFWLDKNNPMLQKVNGENAKEEFNKVFNTFKLDNTTLTSGKRGVKVIELYSDKKSMPKKADIEARALISKVESGKEIEIIALPPEYIREYVYDIKLVPNPKNPNTKEIDKALQLEKVRIYLSFFPELVNKQELAAQTAEKMGDDPTKILNSDIFNPVPEENPEMAQQMSTNPTQNNANNMVRGMMGGQMEAGLGQLSNIQSNING